MLPDQQFPENVILVFMNGQKRGKGELTNFSELEQQLFSFENDFQIACDFLAVFIH